ncbi:NFX1-type zinc finger-containing protein 1 [Porphyridium purpureum]|uniref:NFX1-type zinc finger-containing protein 1 n=1 Tax=Porphyridium purpureum TaxID=35688 RepID=A0A5J4YQN8_PORPP|nr:NFX1-type zinc finger-containing protein 1 [Porphyridium purpureum]|eukprot:POR7882..scf295_9
MSGRGKRGDAGSGRGGRRANEHGWDAKISAPGDGSPAAGPSSVRRSETRQGSAIARGGETLAARVSPADVRAPASRPGLNSPWRRFFDRAMKDQTFTFENTASVQKFVDACVGFSDEVDLLFRLASPAENGERLLRDVVLRAVNVADLLPLLGKFGGDQLAFGLAKQHVNKMLEHMLRAGLPGRLLEALKTGTISKPLDLSVVSWFTVRLAACSNEARVDAALCSLKDELLTRDAPLSNRLKNLFASSEVDDTLILEAAHVVLDDTRFRPGGRHDNDAVDFRLIRIVPTIEELNSPLEPYLPRQVDNPSEAALQERQFRLLREDFLCPIRDTLREMARNPKKHQHHVFTDVQCVGIELGRQPCLEFAFRFPRSAYAAQLCRKAGKNDMKKKRDLVEFWQSKRGLRVLPRDSLVCLVCSENTVQEVFVVQRPPSAADPSRMSEWEFFDQHGPTPSVGLVMHGNSEASCVRLARFLKNVGRGVLPGWRLIEAGQSLFSYGPVLRSLQGQACVALAEELVYKQEPKAATYLAHVKVEDEIERIEAQAGFKLDERQRDALRMACNVRCSVTVGGPGSGKSFFGVCLADIICRNTSKKVLCITYTNHALDDFLGDLVKQGITSIVRVGGRASKEVAKFNLRDLARARCGGAGKAYGGCPSVEEIRARRHYRALKHTERGVLQSLEDTGEELRNLNAARSAHVSWETLKDWLCSEYPEAYAELCIDGLVESEGYSMVGKDGKKVQSSSLFRRWIAGEDRGPLFGSSSPLRESSVWKMNLADRKVQVDQWCDERAQDVQYRCAVDLLRLQDLRRDMTLVGEWLDRQVLMDARIIACTTTGAAKYRALLEECNISVVIVEEAGEVLEANTLAALQEKTEHLIMIGDHQQLRPKLQSYKLSTGSREGHNFNVSLFERLVLSSHIEHGELNVQHRMRPEISVLIKPSYPDQEDGPGTQKRESIRGVSSNVMFIDHDHQEDSSQVAGGEEDATLKANAYEVEMVVAVVRYLLQNGYRPDEIVVLTPYLAQLYALSAALAADPMTGGAFLDDRDREDFDAHSISSPGSGSDTLGSDASMFEEKRRSVRVATVDNYQGEESRIVVASLVRCNRYGSIGFLSEPERVNVLLSRARDGLIIFGSARTLRNAYNTYGRQIWTNLLDRMQQEKQILRCFPARCQEHGIRPDVPLLSRAAFDHWCPAGGCLRDCRLRLPCGHDCPLKCHGFDRMHTHVKCMETTTKYCDKGHLFESLCGAPVDASRQCRTCAELAQLVKQAKQEMVKLRKEHLRIQEAAALKRTKAQAEAADLRRRIDALEAEEAAILKQTVDKLELKKLREELEARKSMQTLDTIMHEADAREPVERAIQQELIRRKEEALRKLKEVRKQLELLKVKEAASAMSLSELNKETKLALEKIEMKEWHVAVAMGSKQGQLLQAVLTRSLRRKIFDAVSSPNGAKLCRQVLDETNDEDFQSGLYFLSAELKGLISALRSVDAQDSGAKRVFPNGVLPPVLCNVREMLRKNDYVGAVQLLRSSAADDCTTSSSARLVKEMLTMLCELQLGCMPSDVRVHGLHEQVRQIESSCESALYYVTRALFEKHGDHVLDAYGFALSGIACSNGLMDLFPECLDIACSIIAALESRMDAVLAKQGAGSEERREAEEFKRRAGQCPALKAAMELVGCRKVKHKLLELKDLVTLAMERGDDLSRKQFNAMFYGNPGVGKTTVARIYASVLFELGILPGNIFEETTGSKLLRGGVAELRRALDRVRDDGVSPIPRGARVETDVLEKGAWVPGRVTFSALTGNDMHIQFDEKELGSTSVFARNRVRWVEKAGVLFIDEAYQLKPTKNSIGAQILDTLLTEMQECRGKLVVVFAGYKKEMEDLLEYNEGLLSRFHAVYDFEDFTDEELYIIMESRFRSLKNYKLPDPKHMRIASRRIGKGRGHVGFGNARAVRSFVEVVQEKQAGRIVEVRGKGGNPDAFEFVREDLLGPHVQSMLDSATFKELQNQIGLRMVKESMSTLFQVLQTNAELEEAEKPMKGVLLNRLFVGNPGTGKTTCAKLYGRMLKELGLLSKGDLIVKNPSDFIGSVLGESEKKTRAILENSKGCVLFIDQAYGLGPSKSKIGGMSWSEDPYKRAVLDTLVAEVQGVPGDDRCVLMCGYTKEMDDFIRYSNPGLKRRFQADEPFVFEDYNDTELCQILLKMAKEKKVVVCPEALRKAVERLAKDRMKPNFGNGGAVATLIQAAAQRAEKRMQHLGPVERAAANELLAQDFVPEQDEAAAARAADPLIVLDGLIGCNSVRNQLSDIQALVRDAERHGRDPMESIELNFKFVGPPGTGKSTVARRMGEMFEALGLLADGKTFVQCSASDLQTRYVGQAGNVTREKFEAARGGVLFMKLREAGFYSSTRRIVCTTPAVDAFKGKMVVIFAGYEAEIEEMMSKVNPGLKSRVTQTIRFDVLDASNTWQLLQMQLKKAGKPLDHEAKAKGIVFAELAYSGSTCEQVPRSAPLAASPMRMENMTEEEEHEGEPAIDNGDDNDSIVAALEAACVGLGYDKDLPSRQKLQNILALIQAGGPFDEEILEYVRKNTGADKAVVERVLRAQVSSLLCSISARNRFEISEILRLEALEEVERERERAKLAAKQLQLKSIGVCPAGYSWCPEGDGWRCAGGSHFIHSSKLN